MAEKLEAISGGVPEKSLVFVVSPERVRLLANGSRKRDISTPEAAAFLGLFRGEIEEALGRTLAGVVRAKFNEK